MGRALPGHYYCRCRSVLFGGPRQETASLAVEYSQSQEILPLSVHTQGYMLNVMPYVHIVNYCKSNVCPCRCIGTCDFIVVNSLSSDKCMREIRSQNFLKVETYSQLDYHRRTGGNLRLNPHKGRNLFSVGFSSPNMWKL